jgi:hypothetical protein
VEIKASTKKSDLQDRLEDLEGDSDTTACRKDTTKGEWMPAIPADRDLIRLIR